MDRATAYAIGRYIKNFEPYLIFAPFADALSASVDMAVGIGARRACSYGLIAQIKAVGAIGCATQRVNVGTLASFPKRKNLLGPSAGSLG